MVWRRGAPHRPVLFPQKCRGAAKVKKAADVKVTAGSPNLPERRNTYGHTVAFERQNRKNAIPRNALRSQLVDGIIDSERCTMSEKAQAIYEKLSRLNAIRPETPEIKQEKIALIEEWKKIPRDMTRVYEILSRRHDGGEPDIAERHNEHQP
jgi:hypothetical protein